MQAGLGGGSADAAAALLGLARLWGGAPLDAAARGRRRRSAPTSPFFLSGGTALGLGRGEEIYPLVDLPPHWVVDRPAAVRRLDRRGLRWYDEDRAAGLEGAAGAAAVCPCPWPTRAAQMVNDLEPPVVRRHPEIARAAEDRCARRGRWRRR